MGLKDQTNEESEPIIRKTKSVCPTCQGKGKLTQGQADNVVALIPAGDKRLKPRRTKLYLAITSIVSFICISLIAFFLWPRQVDVAIIDVRSTKIHMPFIGIPWIELRVTYELNNQNFFQAEISNLKTVATWNKFTMDMPVESKPIIIKGLSRTNHSYIVKQEFSGKLVSDKVKFSCIIEWEWSLFETFYYSATVSVLLRSELIGNTYYGYIKCYEPFVSDRIT